MKFYILDDLISCVKVMTTLIESRNLGEVIGSQTDSEKGLSEILALNPDIVLIDLLMPKKDGISVVNEIKEINQSIDFVMISQVIDKAMISDAYRAGIEFYISKPNDVVEIENVLRRVIEKREMATMLSGIRSVMGNISNINKIESSFTPDTKNATHLAKVKKTLGAIGMLGESGTKDIINIFQMLVSTDKVYDKTTQNSYAQSIGEDPKIVKQRIRRAIKRGLTNTAAMGLEDYYGEAFDRFSHALFNFEAVRSEMDLLRGKSIYGGRPSVDKFFEGLQVICELSAD